jgi:transposase-like protein
MARRGRPAPQLVLTGDERAILQHRLDDEGLSSDARLRAGIVLACADGKSNVEVAVDLAVHRMTVAKWRIRFLERRLEGLQDEARPGRPRLLSDDQVADVVTATIAELPAASNWSQSKMAQRFGLSPSTVGRIWRMYGLAPHQSRSPEGLAMAAANVRVVDIAGVYLYPPQRVVALCVMPPPATPALDWSTPLARPHGHQPATAVDLLAARLTVTSLLRALNVDADPRPLGVGQFGRLLSTLDACVPAQLDVHAICVGLPDPLDRPTAVWLNRHHPRIRLDLARELSSWTNEVGQLLLRLASRGYGDRPAESVPTLERHVASWAWLWATKREPLLWAKDTDELQQSLAGIS